MVNLTLGNISIKSMSHSSGFFIGTKNTHREFRSLNVIDEVFGTFSGNDNRCISCNWVNHKQTVKGDSP